ncbi:MAG: adenylate/guanylate cyclase domain-containing protein [Planctomycetes bacterium]|nr:adenylate/guanylate cyclase domain-containing protein [Planctomycetota bacterium]
MLRRLLTAILKPSPFKVGLLATLAVLLLCRYGLKTGINENLRKIDILIQDELFKARGPLPLAEGQTRREAVVIDIDEKSLAVYGQWPWPRDLVAKLLAKVDEAKPKAIGLDLVFAEPDRSSPKNVLKRVMLEQLAEATVPEEPPLSEPDDLLESLKKILDQGTDLLAQDLAVQDYDQMLAEVVENSPRIVLGYFFLYDDDGLRDQDVVPYGGGFGFSRTDKSMPGSPFEGRIPYRPVLNIPILDDAAEDRCGCFSTSFDDSGKVRKVPLVWEFEGNPYPLLALQMLRVGLGRVSGTVDIGPNGVSGLRVGKEIQIPTDVIGQFYVNFRGPQKTFEYYSAADVLTDQIAPEVFKDRYVLLGTSAGGLRDLRATPFEDDCPGVEVHANVIDNILVGDFIKEPVWLHGVEQFAIIIIGLLLAVVVAYFRPLTGGLVTLVVLLAIPLVNYILMFPSIRNGYIVSTAYPLLTVFLVFAPVMLLNYFFEGRKKRFIKNAFSTYLSKEVVDQLVNAPDKLSLKGEERELTVLFSDIRSFTSISEKLSAEGLANFLNEYLTPMADLVMATQGCVDKFIGDAVVAFWGAPMADPAHARHAAQSSLRMIAALNEMQPEWEARGLPQIKIGIGLNTGMMRVGNMGSTTRFDYTVMGDNVNLGSRLENLNKTYGTSIIVSVATRQALGEEFYCRVLDKVRVKGKQEPVKIYELICEGEPPAEVRAEVTAFEAAFADYQAQRFAEAQKKLLAVQKESPKLLHKIYLSRIDAFLETPPAKDWDGVYTFTSK